MAIALPYGEMINLLSNWNSSSSYLSHRFKVLTVTLGHCAGIIYVICTEDRSVKACQPKQETRAGARAGERRHTTFI
jgi:hypothetical protein